MYKVFFILLFSLNIFANTTPQSINLSDAQWEYRWTDISPIEKTDGWEAISFPSNPPNRDGQTNVWYRIKLPATLPQDPFLYIYSIDLIAQVYLEQKMIYSFGEFDENAQGKFVGWPWHLIKLDPSATNKYLYFRVYSDYPDIGLWGEVSIASKGDHLKKMFDNDLLSLSVGAIALFIGILFLIVYLKSKVKIEFLFVGLLFLTQGVDLILSTKVIQFYFDYPLLKQYILAFCYFFLPVGIAGFLERVIGRGYFGIIRKIWQIHLGYIVIAFTGAFIGLYNVSSLYTYYDYLHYFFTLPILTIFVLYSLLKGDKEKKIVSIGFLLITLSWLYSSLIAWGLIPWSEHTNYLAVFICLFLFAYVLIRRVLYTQEIQKQKEEFETIFKYSKDGIAITDLESNFLECNEAYLHMTGFTKEELFQKSCIGMSAPEDRQRSTKVIQKVLQDGFIENFEKTCIIKDGERIEVNMTISLLPDQKRFLVVTKDVTALKNIEDQSRLIAMGEMIGNIAHQWRQPLSMITTSASGMKLKLEYEMYDQEKFIELSDIILNQAQYLSDTIDNFRDFIKGDITFSQISVVEVLQKSLSLVNDAFKDNYITLVTDLKDDMKINGSINELSQAFINIFNNAKDVLKQKVSKESDRIVYVETKKRTINSIEVFIKDSAGGIDPDIIDRIFEPYFTTKHKSVGTGLGLSMTHKIIVKKHKGDIEAYNDEFEYDGKLYQGACFQITLTKDP
jgi:PAS domain S-box-containing protein